MESKILSADPVEVTRSGDGIGLVENVLNCPTKMGYISRAHDGRVSFGVNGEAVFSNTCGDQDHHKLVVRI